MHLLPAFGTEAVSMTLRQELVNISSTAGCHEFQCTFPYTTSVVARRIQTTPGPNLHVVSGLNAVYTALGESLKDLQITHIV